MSKWEKTGQPCPCGNSSDGYAIDKEGKGYCYGSCGGKFFRNGIEQGVDDIATTSKFFPDRGLTLHTLKQYNIQTSFVDDEPYKTGFPYPKVDSVASFKIRNLMIPKGQKGHFGSVGPIGKAGLFGADKFPAGSKKSITITEGEYDAPSLFQAADGYTAAVSITSSASAKRDIKASWDYINSFSKIIFAFDNDVAGQAALEDVVSMFDFKKTYICKFDLFKDANAYLQNGKVKELYETWKSAKKYTPTGIINGFSDIKTLLGSRGTPQLGTYPLGLMQHMLKGFHAGEFVLFKGLEGVGKTEVFRLLEDHLLSTTNHSIAIIHLEENTATTIKAIATYYKQEPMNVEDQNYSLDDIYQAYLDAVKGNEDRLYFQSSAGLQEEQSVLDNMRFLAVSCNCKIIFFDHISWLAVNTEDGEDERKKLDRIAAKIQSLAEELGICIISVSHVNDQGQTRGSRYITKVANTVIHMVRDLVSEDEEERNTIKFFIEKARTAGAKTGPAGSALFDEVSNTLKERVAIPAPLG